MYDKKRGRDRQTDRQTLVTDRQGGREREAKFSCIDIGLILRLAHITTGSLFVLTD